MKIFRFIDIQTPEKDGVLADFQYEVSEDNVFTPINITIRSMIAGVIGRKLEFKSPEVELAFQTKMLKHLQDTQDNKQASP